MPIRLPRLALFGATLAAACSLPTLALDPSLSLSQYARQHWQVEDGLPQNYVTGISQSQDGYLVVGTSGGAALFDGLRFTPLVLDRATGRSREWITGVLPGPNFSLWVATRDDGFYQLGRPGEAPRGHWPFRFDSLATNPQGKLFGLGPGIHEWHNGNLRQHHRGFTPADPSWNGLLTLSDGGLLAATAQGLFHFTGPSASPQQLLDDRHGRVLALAPARQGGFWVGTAQGLLHLALPATSKAAPAIRSIVGVRGPIVSIVEDSDGLLWAASWGFGLFRVQSGRVDATTIRDGLDDDFVHALFEDREKNLWVGTRAGLTRWRSTSLVPYGPPEGLPAQFISSIVGGRSLERTSPSPKLPRNQALSAAGETLYLGSWRTGLYRLSPGETPQRIPLPGPDLRVLVRAMAVAPNGALWLSDWGRLFERTAGGWQPHAPNLQVNALLFDHRGQLWLGTADGVHTQDRHVWTGPAISVLAEDGQGNIWAGGKDGLWRITHHSPLDSQATKALPNRGNKVEQFSNQLTVTPIPGLPHPHVTSLQFDTEGHLWVTTRANGVSRWMGTHWKNLDQRNGLPALPLYAFVDDGQGSYWLSSPAGIFQVPVAELSRTLQTGQRLEGLAAYTQEDGLRTIECQSVGHPAAWKTATGEIWFPTARGAVRIRPAKRQPAPSVAVLVESLQSKPDGHVLRFTASRLAAPAAVEFRYQLLSHGQEWSSAGTERTLHFDRLSPGRHELRIEARDHGGAWGPTAVVTLDQTPRFYQTWWFVGLSAGALAALLLGLYRWRLYLLRSQYTAVLLERNRIAREWHDTLLAGFSSLSWQLDITLQHLPDKPQAAASAVAAARQMVQYYRAEARRVIWDLRQNLADEESLPAQLTNALQQLTAGQAITTQIAVHGTALPIPGEIRQNLLRICQEAATNAIQHGGASQIQIDIQFQPQQIQLEVKDDGQGFLLDSVGPGHFGLQIMQERATRFGGSLHVNSSPGAGSTIRAIIPLPEGKP